MLRTNTPSGGNAGIEFAISGFTDGTQAIRAVSSITLVQYKPTTLRFTWTESTTTARIDNLTEGTTTGDVVLAGATFANSDKNNCVIGGRTSTDSFDGLIKQVRINADGVETTYNPDQENDEWFGTSDYTSLSSQQWDAEPSYRGVCPRNAQFVDHGCLVLDGTQYIVIDNSEDYSGSDFVLSGVFERSATGNKRIFSQQEGSGTARSWLFFTSIGGTDPATEIGGSVQYWDEIVCNVDTPYSFTLTKETNNYTLVVNDGTASQTQTITLSAHESADGDFVLGSNDDFNNSFEGKVSNFKLVVEGTTVLDIPCSDGVSSSTWGNTCERVSETLLPITNPGSNWGVIEGNVGKHVNLLEGFTGAAQLGPSPAKIQFTDITAADFSGDFDFNRIPASLDEDGTDVTGYSLTNPSGVGNNNSESKLDFSVVPASLPVDGDIPGDGVLDPVEFGGDYGDVNVGLQTDILEGKFTLEK